MVNEKWQSLTESPASDKTLHDLCLEGDQFWKELKMTAAMVDSIPATQTRTQNSGGAGTSVTANIANTRGGNAIKCDICSYVCRTRKEHPRGTEECFLRGREGDEKKKSKISTMMQQTGQSEEEIETAITEAMENWDQSRTRNKAYLRNSKRPRPK